MVIAENLESGALYWFFNRGGIIYVPLGLYYLVIEPGPILSQFDPVDFLEDFLLGNFSTAFIADGVIAALLSNLLALFELHYTS